MPMINFSEPLPLFIATILFVLVLWFAKQSKKSVITGIMLFVFVTMLIGHAVEFSMGEHSLEEISVITNSIVFDLVFVFISFISYLWIDDIEAKYKKKKSIDNSLDWFWSKV